MSDDPQGRSAVSDPSKPDLTAQTLAAVVAGAVGLTGGPIGPFIGTAAYPVLERITMNAVAEVRAARWQRAVTSIGVAKAIAGTTEEEFLAEFAKRPRLLDLAGEVIESASSARLEGKVRALGEALAKGYLAQDGAVLDKEFFIVAALNELEAPHVRLLDFIVRLRPRVINHELLDQAMPGLAALHESLMGTLRRHALIREVQMVTQGQGVTGQPTFQSEPEVYATELGKEILERIRAGAADDDSSRPRGEPS